MALLEAVRSQDLKLLRNLIDQGTDPNHKDEDGVTSLHIAAGLDNIEFLSCLLEYGAKVDSVTSEGLTPLHIAAMWGKSDHVNMLLSYEANVSLKDNAGFDAYAYALSSSEDESNACIELLAHHFESIINEDDSHKSHKESELFLTACGSPESKELSVFERTPTAEINLEKLEGSPWITPRRKRRTEKRNRRHTSDCEELCEFSSSSSLSEGESSWHTSDKDIQSDTIFEFGKADNVIDKGLDLSANNDDEGSDTFDERSCHFASDNYPLSVIFEEKEEYYTKVGEGYSLGYNKDFISSKKAGWSNTENNGHGIVSNNLKLECYEDYLTEMSLELFSDSGDSSDLDTVTSDSSQISFVNVWRQQQQQNEQEQAQQQHEQQQQQRQNEQQLPWQQQQQNEQQEQQPQQLHEQQEQQQQQQQQQSEQRQQQSEEQQQRPQQQDQHNGSRSQLNRTTIVDNHQNSSKPLQTTFTINDNHNNPRNIFIPLDTNNHQTSEPVLKTNTANTQYLTTETIIYDWKDLSMTSDSTEEPVIAIPPIYQRLTPKQIKNKIIQFGQTPGPITPHTKQLYLKKLCKLEQGVTSKTAKNHSPFNQYPAEVRMVLMGRSPIPDCCSLEEEIMKDFGQSSKRAQWRGGNEKSSFNYLLLDPRVSCNLPSRCKEISKTEAFRCFILSVFYVGKGKRSRPYAHLHEAVKSRTNGKMNKKLAQIWDVWGAGLGIISLHLFQSAIAVEAFTREACMLDALGLPQLTNQKRGEYYGLCSGLPLRKKRNLGIFFLHKAFQIFLQEGERQIKEEDL